MPSSNHYSKVFTREEWQARVKKESVLVDEYDVRNLVTDTSNDNNKKLSKTIYQTGLSTRKTISEPSIPKLLLNYFVTMAYESASIRLAKELGIIESNKDIKDFLNLYKIEERAKIMVLIKKGKIGKVIDEINSNFGIEVLELTEDRKASNKKSDDDLHFKLLLLNLIEMIRAHNNDTRSNDSIDPNDDSEFIMSLVEYAQNKLILKVSSNEIYMKELELVMTLLLFPQNKPDANKSLSDSETEDVQIPQFLTDYYSLSLRSKIAEAVNRRLLNIIHPSIIKRSGDLLRFPDLISTDSISKYQNHSNNMSQTSFFLNTQSKRDKAANGDDSQSDDMEVEKTDSQINVRSPQPNHEQSTSNYWTSTKNDIISNNDLNDNDYTDDPSVHADDSHAKRSLGSTRTDLSDIQYESKLIKLMKLWCWCENKLHEQDIGVPRVTTNE
ncbi:hypothetical protein TPHA_0G02140 [Tetrapisispora phaffii CBS 4417]|uniref:CTLH domain-containing protein n=1 Tax=Tetrapisispora phaffii (strain ATCC 24235 / CBS 4417 / NBRC 1672 / NRRL Y-8282 / UCD 70-5) TaxID=1071381 RepID=G8BVX2_TETPH|nr:hypothetical protein TPHA_0G02140 [Tetrapisispora phaffii CBS 4417]CCE64050.1 hypothetical protein TPHA_0G02140 [Tetrapisispora phaffii CBS 4417]